MSPRIVRIASWTLLLAAWTANSAAGDEPPKPDLLEASAEQDGLRLSLRVLPEGSRKRTFRVGTPIEVEVRVTNLGATTVRVPFEQQTDVWFQHERTYPDLSYCGYTRVRGRADGTLSAPRQALSLAPNTSASFVRKGSPVRAGPAQLVARLQNHHAGTSGEASRPKSPTAEAKPPALWIGRLSVALAIEATLDSYDMPFDVARLNLEHTGWLERVEAMARLVADVPDQRAVLALTRDRPGSGSGRSLQHPLERSAYLMHLLVAAKRGYGIDALGEHTEAVADKNNAPEVRSWGLAGAALALQHGAGVDIPARERGGIGAKIWIEVEPGIRREARRVVAAIAADADDPLKPRAEAVLEDPETLPPQDPPRR